MPTIINGTTGVDKVQDGVVSATSIPNGELPIAKLATTGTASSSTYLRGDGSWQTISTTPTTDQVLAATAGASVGAVGTYALLGRVGGTSITPGLTLAGSSLRYTGFCGLDTAVYTKVGSLSSTVIQQDQNTAPAGTWRCMGTQFGGASSGTTAHPATVWLRIS